MALYATKYFTDSSTTLIATIPDRSKNKIIQYLSSVYSSFRKKIHFNETFWLESIPQSMTSIQTFHQWHSFCFTGCLLAVQQSSQKPSSLKSRFQRWKTSLKCGPLIRWLLILFSLLTMYSYIKPLVEPIEADRSDDIIKTLDPNGTNRQIQSGKLKFKDLGAFVTRIAWATDQSEEMSQLKPILRMIMQWMVYIFLIDEFVTFGFNLIFGGTLLHKLTSIDELLQVDTSRSFGRWLLASHYLMIICIKLAGIWLYEREALMMMLFPEDNKTLYFALFKFSLETMLHVTHFVYLSMNGIWFVYSMVMFRRSIELLQEQLVEAVELDEWTLGELCDRITRLNCQFRNVMRYFSLPITLDLASNAFMLIGSSCFMIINQDNRNVQPQVAGFIFCVGLFALARLVAICSVGNQPLCAARTLSRRIYENKPEWTVHEWMCYREIKRFSREFHVNMFRIVSVQQSTILTMLGFVLNYIVILLQTENYVINGSNVTLSSGNASLNVSLNPSM